MLKAIVALILLCIYCSCNNERIVGKARSLYEEGKKQEEAEQPDSAVMNYQSALELLENSREYALLGEINNRIGDILQEHNLYLEATKFHNNAYHYGIELKDKTIASKSLREIGKDFLFNCKDDTLSWPRRDSVFTYFSKALQLIDQVKNKEEIAAVYNNLSGIFREYGNYKKSMEYNQKAIQTSDNEKVLYYNYYSRGELYIALHKYDSAIFYFKRSLSSESLFTQCGAYDYLYQIALATGSADSVSYLQKYIYLNETIDQANCTPELSLAITQQKLKQAIKEKDNEYSVWIIIVLFICCTLFVLYRKSFKRKLFFVQKEFAIKSRIFQHELKENKWVGNLKALKESEEAQITDQLVQISSDCIGNLKKDPVYQKVCDLLSTSATLSFEERSFVYQTIKRFFSLYVKELSHYIQLGDDDYFLCCMALVGFSTKQCAFCRGVGDAAIRIRRKRIKEKIGVYFHSDKLYDSIFGKKY